MFYLVSPFGHRTDKKFYDGIVQLIPGNMRPWVVPHDTGGTEDEIISPHIFPINLLGLI